MGLFSFAKDIGDKIFHRNKDAAPASNGDKALGQGRRQHRHENEQREI